MTHKDFVRRLAIRMVTTKHNSPILGGNASPREPCERDRLRQEFAEWFVRDCIDGARLKVVDERKGFEGSDMAGFAQRGNAGPTIRKLRSWAASLAERVATVKPFLRGGHDQTLACSGSSSKSHSPGNGGSIPISGTMRFVP